MLDESANYDAFYVHKRVCMPHTLLSRLKMGPFNEPTDKGRE
jgi:hypothetical protein